jgi:hypothetical protein
VAVDAAKSKTPVATGPDGRVVVAIIGALALVLIGYFALGMPGMDHGTATEHTEHEAEQEP